jgi:hypothetical protein
MSCCLRESHSADVSVYFSLNYLLVFLSELLNFLRLIFPQTRIVSHVSHVLITLYIEIFFK